MDELNYKFCMYDGKAISLGQLIAYSLISVNFRLIWRSCMKQKK